MATINKFEDLEVWKLSRILTRSIWNITQSGAFYRDFALRDQINRSSGSVMDNIAEGFGRGGNREFVNFLGYSGGSNLEVQSQLYRALDRSHIGTDEYHRLLRLSKLIAAKINNLSDHLQHAKIRGRKFRGR